ncbi:MAG TPA: alpha/beta hydrolase [Verrucomicrobiae bacterium]|nr:alpha/beta hydrolase [Verrucomicrobiae bacterium]
MITDRNVESDGLGPSLSRNSNPLSFWTSDGVQLEDFTSWEKASQSRFVNLLLATAGAFPLIEQAEHEDQQHVTLFVHGYNENWKDAVRFYQNICNQLFAGDDSLGVCVLFTWPSDGAAAAYLPDRVDARRAAPDLASVLSALYDQMLDAQTAAATDPDKACRAKTSIIAHSMGNWLLQKAMQIAWTRKNQPLLVSLVNQLLMVAADVDNDLFKGGETTDKGDGDAIANLTYRVTALYTGRDPVLGLSAGLKHFGKRRLGRSGLDRTTTPPDNVWDVDCSSLIAADAENIHSAYFSQPGTLKLMRELLRGADRQVLVNAGIAPAQRA